MFGTADFVESIPFAACLLDKDTLAVTYRNSKFHQLIDIKEEIPITDVVDLPFDIRDKTDDSETVYIIPVYMSDAIMYAVFLILQKDILCIVFPSDKMHSFVDYEYRHLLNVAPFGIFMISPEGKLLYANRSLRKMLGHHSGESSDSAKSCVGDNIMNMPSLSQSAIGDDIKRVIETRQHLSSRAEYISCKGNRIDARYHLFPIIHSGKFHKIIGIIELLEGEKNSQELKHEKLIRQRLELVGMLADGIAHDFNNIVTSFLGYIDDSLELLADTHPVYENLMEMRQAANSASNLVYQLLTFSRNQLLERKVIDLNTLLKSLRGMLSRLVEENIHLEMNLHPEPLWVKVDPSQIEQVVINLLVNARDSIDGHGTITIDTTKGRMWANPSESEGADSGYHQDAVLMTVTDTGSGIPPEVLPHIFEPFFSTKKEKGTGLGLATSYGIIRQHEGNISVTSKQGEGTKFTIYLPVATEKRPLEIKRKYDDRSDISIQSEDITVMFVEDEPRIRKIMKSHFRRAGIRAVMAANGREALEKARALSPLDVLITDIVMPTMSGVELAEQIRNLYPFVQVIYTSGYPDDRIGHEINEDLFVAKPYTFRDLMKKISELTRND